MAVNKIIINNQTRLDLTSDTVSTNNLLSGYTAHDATGNSITGTVTFCTYYTGTTVPSSSLGENGDIYLKGVS